MKNFASGQLFFCPCFIQLPHFKRKAKNMQINSVSQIGFGAKLMRNSKVINPGNPETSHCKSTSKQDMIDSYDRQIKKIEAQKQIAIEFDEFMHTPEVQEKVKSLPKEDELEMGTKFTISDSDEYGFDMTEPCLVYECHNDDSADKLYSLDRMEQGDVVYFQDTQNEDGSINKQGIMDYLDKLVNFFNN